MDQEDATQPALLASPPGWPLTATVLIASALTLWELSLPGSPDIFIGMLVLVGWLGLGGLWLLRLVVYLRQNRAWVPVRGHRLRWCVIPSIVLVTAALIFAGLPLRLRFQAGEAELERFAQEVVAEGPRDVDKSGRIGTFEISPWSVERFGDDGMRFAVDDRLGGFAYSPTRDLNRNDNYNTAYYHLKGPWYEWVPRFH